MIIWMWDIFELSIFQSDSPSPLLILLKFHIVRNFKEWVSDTRQEHMNMNYFLPGLFLLEVDMEMGDTWLHLTNWKKKNLITPQV